jgi:hypothetical protein
MMPAMFVPAVLVAMLCGQLQSQPVAPAQQLAPSTPASAPANTKYMCPMRCEGDKSYDQPGRCPVCKMKLKAQASEGPLKLTLALADPPADELKPLKPTTLKLQLSLAEPSDQTGALKSLEGASVHLLIASDDLGWFAHEEPRVESDGAMHVRLGLARPGRFLFFADVTEAARLIEVTPLEVIVPGTPPARTHLAADDGSPIRVSGGYVVALGKHEPLKAGASSRLAFTITRNGKPVNAEANMGESGQLVLVREDLSRCVRIAAARPVGNPGARGSTRSQERPLVFDATVAAPGLYRAWLEFRDAGQVLAAPFVLEVKP